MAKYEVFDGYNELVFKYSFLMPTQRHDLHPTKLPNQRLQNYHANPFQSHTLHHSLSIIPEINSARATATIRPLHLNVHGPSLTLPHGSLAGEHTLDGQGIPHPPRRLRRGNAEIGKWCADNGLAAVLGDGAALACGETDVAFFVGKGGPIVDGLWAA